MSETKIQAADLAPQIVNAPRTGRRRLVAIAGPPASGKSTLAAALVEELKNYSVAAQVVPMDGFHLDNRLLIDRGLLAKKGAPETFDPHGFHALVHRCKEEELLYYPMFDRSKDVSIAGAGEIMPSCDTVIFEGNYLLFDDAAWRGLRAEWDLAIRLSVPLDILRVRLITRWIHNGFTPVAAKQRTESNDLSNVRTVEDNRLPADVTIKAE